MVQDDVLFRDPVVELGRFGAFRRHDGDEAGIKEFRAADHVDQAAEAEHVDRTRDAERVVGGQVDRAEQPLHLALRNVGFDLEPHGRALAEVADLLLDSLQ